MLIADPQVIKEMFTGDPDVLHAGEANATPLEPSMGRNSVLLLDGPEHMRQRKLMLPSFHGERMQRYGELMREITERGVDALAGRAAVRLRPRTQAITLEIIMRAVFGIDEAERLARLRERLSPMLDMGMRPARDGRQSRFRRCGARSASALWERFLRLRDAADELIYDEIRRRRDDPDTPSATTCSRSCCRRATRTGRR